MKKRYSEGYVVVIREFGKDKPIGRIQATEREVREEAKKSGWLYSIEGDRLAIWGTANVTASRPALVDRVWPPAAPLVWLALIAFSPIVLVGVLTWHLVCLIKEEIAYDLAIWKMGGTNKETR